MPFCLIILTRFVKIIPKGSVMGNLMDCLEEYKLACFFQKAMEECVSKSLTIDSNGHTFWINNCRAMMSVFKKFGKVDKNFSCKDCSANYNRKN